jgi:hypothetical protein
MKREERENEEEERLVFIETGYELKKLQGFEFETLAVDMIHYCTIHMNTRIYGSQKSWNTEQIACLSFHPIRALLVANLITHLSFIMVRTSLISCVYCERWRVANFERTN